MTVATRPDRGFILDVLDVQPVSPGSLLSLGALVSYTHRAAVIRWKRPERGLGGLWLPTEGVARGEPWPEMLPPEPADDDPEKSGEWLIGAGGDSDPFYSTQPTDGVNKTVMVWPAAGTGTLTGFVRRGIGQSHPPTGGTGGLFDDSFEPGGFTAHRFVPLYAVRHRLQGLDYILVPVPSAAPARVARYPASP